MGLNVTRISSVEYLQSTVMVGDASVGTSMTGNGLTAYYTESGNPPGKWLGSGVDGLNVAQGAAIGSGEAVAVWQKFRNPVTHERIGKPPISERTTQNAANDNQLAESTEQVRRDVAGFDLTFTIPKDASILWAIGDTGMQARIAACHERALHATLAEFESTILQSRAGHGGVAAVGVKGLIGGQWDHWDNREGEPHLHSHVVVSNRVQRASDGKWVTIDSRALYRHAVMLSEVHQNLFMDELHRDLGVEWTQREDVASKAVIPDIVGMPEEIRDRFSTRSAAIDRDLAGRIEVFRERAGRDPSHRELLEMKQSAWRATRKPKDKNVTPLAEKCEQWRTRVEETGTDAGEIVRSCVDRDRDIDLTASTSHSVHEVLAALTADALADRQDSHSRDPAAGAGGAEQGAEEASEEALVLVADGVVDTLQREQATWTLANVRAEAERITRLVRASSPQVRLEAVETIVDAVLERSVELTPRRYRLIDPEDQRIALRGRSVFDDVHRAQWTSQATLDREADLLGALTTSGAVDAPAAEDVATFIDAFSQRQLAERGFGLAEDQARAVAEVVGADSRMSVVIGPAGTGKTTTMAAVRDVWSQLAGEGSVVGLATSAQAAHVLAEDMNAPAHTIRKWLYEATEGRAKRSERIHDLQARLGRARPAAAAALRAEIAKEVAQLDAWQLKPGQLVVVDEASMTSTPDLHALLQQTEAVGARLVLVGDHRQLDAIEAGGALSLLAENGPVSQLDSVWRFRDPWEADASLTLREVYDETTAERLVTEYNEHGRIQHGDDEVMLDSAYTATRGSISEGKSAILIAATRGVVRDLNERFMHERRLAGEVDATRTATLRDDADAGVGERILARHNDRQLRDSAGDFIRNGTTATVEAIHPDGSLTARRDDSGASILLPATYLAAHTELGYASTAHRSQGVTVDEARLVVPLEQALPAELLYVGMTRGRDLNEAYVGSVDPDEVRADREQAPGRLVADTDQPAWEGRLTQMMLNHGAKESATSTRDRTADDSVSLSRLVPEYEYLASLESPDAVLKDLERLHGIDRTIAEDSPVCASLLAAWRAARATAPEPARLALQQPLTGLDPEQENDPEARMRVITGRLRSMVPPVPEDKPSRVHGLTARVTDVDPAVVHLAGQVQSKIGQRIAQLTERAAPTAWGKDLPKQLRADVAIYRDLYDVRAHTALGDTPSEKDSRRFAHHQALAARLPAPAADSTPWTPHPSHGPTHHQRASAH